MRSLAALSLVLLAGSAGAAEIRFLELGLRVETNGSGHVTAAVWLEGANGSGVLVPTGFPAAAHLRLTEGPAGTTLEARPHGGQTLVRVAWPEETPPPAAVRFEFDVAGILQRPAAKAGEPEASPPPGRWVLRHALVNTEPATIGSYRLTLALPDGTRAHAIREALPRLRKGEAGPRALLEAVGGRAGARLEVAQLVQGETAAIQLELVSGSRSLVWLAIGVVLSLLYLVEFRDLVAGRNEPH